MQFEESQKLLEHLQALLDYSLPLYVKEGKSQLTIAIGCTGGKHRSITFANLLAEHFKQKGYHPVLEHRDEQRYN